MTSSVKSFLFIGHLFSCISLVELFTYLRSQPNIYSLSTISYNLKLTNSSVHKHVHRRQTTKFSAHEIDLSTARQKWRLDGPALTGHHLLIMPMQIAITIT